MSSRTAPDGDRGLPRELTETESAAVDAAGLLAVLGKQVIHVGGRPSTERLFEFGRFEPGQRVLDAGCGVGATAVEVAERFGCEVTAVDIAPTMVERAAATVRAAGLEEAVTVQQGDVLSLPFPDDTFDRVVVEAVVMFVDRDRAAAELVRVCKPGGYVVDHEASFVGELPADVYEASQALFPGMDLGAPETWEALYRSAGLTGVESVSGPAEFVGPRYVLRDEGVAGVLRMLGRAVRHPGVLPQVARVLPLMRRVQPHVDYVVVAGRKPGGAPDGTAGGDEQDRGSGERGDEAPV